MTYSTHLTLKKAFLFFILTIPTALAAQDSIRVIPWVIVPNHTIYLRAEPSSNSPFTDTIKQFSKPEKLIYLYPEQNSQWVKIAHYVETDRHDENGFYLGSQQILENRYILRKDLLENAGAVLRVKTGQKIPARSDNRSSSGFKDNLTEDSGLLYVLYRHSENIVELRLAGGQARYVSAQNLSNNAQPEILKISSIVGEISLDHVQKARQIQFKLRKDYADPFQARTRIPLAVVILMGGLMVASLALSGKQNLSLSVRWAILTLIFVMELAYIVVFGYDFWFCDPYQVGWIKAGLSTVAGLVTVFLQYSFLFHIIGKIKLSAGDFNTRTSMILFTVISVGTVIYTIATNSTSKTRDIVTILMLVATQVLQIGIIAVKLRKHPWQAFMAATLLPLGVFAVLFSALSLFNFLLVFAFIALLVGAWGNSKPSKHIQEESIKSHDRLYKARQCKFFSEGGGYNCSKKSTGCSLAQSGKCDEYFS